MTERLRYCQFLDELESGIVAMVEYDPGSRYSCISRDGSGFVSTARPDEFVSDEVCESQRKDGVCPRGLGSRVLKGLRATTVSV